MLTSSTTKLRVAVSSLELTEETLLKLTCLSTIPAYLGPAGQYADTVNHTVIGIIHMYILILIISMLVKLSIVHLCDFLSTK